MSEASCPSCGAPLPTRNPGVVAAACAYCGTLVTWDAEAIADSGHKSRLPTGFTRLYTGATGTLSGARFTVLGRVRYRTDRARWDEWAVQLDEVPPGSDGVTWITEDDHELAVEAGRQRVPLRADDVSVGARVELLGFSVQDSRDATVARIVTSDPDTAQQVFLEKGIPHTTADLLVVALRHPVEEFQKCLRELRAAETNLDFAYTLLPHPEGLTLVALHVEDVDFSQSVLHRAGVKILSQEGLSR